MIIPYNSGDTANERILYSNRVFHYNAVHVKIVFFSPEMLKNIFAVMGCFAHILASKNTGN